MNEIKSSTSLQEKEHKLFSIWRSRVNEFIEDGVVDEQQFLQQKRRYVFVLKEANQMGKTTLTEFLRNGAPQNGGHTWNPVCRWLTGETSRVFSPDERKDILRRIAVMNLKKEDGGNKTDMRNLEKVVECDKEYIKAQMEIYIQYSPVIFVCCGPWLLTMLQKHVFIEADIQREAALPFIKPDPNHEAYFVAFFHPNARKAGLAEKFKFVQTLING